ncbi:MAG: type II and III secretion system protein family protein [Desulfuromonadales bacterium]|nr:type II and III secretion system protein family protein [Desulfuromonadales bacterium]
MIRPRFSFLLGWISPLLLFGLLASFASAAEVDRRTLELKLGGSDLVNTAYPFRRVSIANPDVADVVVISPRVLYVFGKKAGYTSVILWEAGKGQTLLDVVVSLDLTGLKKRLHELYPDQQIEVHSSETGVVLSGPVSGPEIVEQVLRLTKTFLPKLAEGDESQDGTGRSGTGVTNLLQVRGIQQVMLEVKFAEVNRTKGKDWQAGLGFNNIGDNVTGAFSSRGNVLHPLKFSEKYPGPAMLRDGTIASLIDGAIDGILQNPGTLLFNFAGNVANIFLNIDDFSAALTLMENEGLARTLAEPRLVTQSGQEASFLAGGEFPIPVPQGDGKISIDYKEFGVALVFTPVVLSDGRISLRVAPSVTDIVGAQIVPAGIVGADFIVPNLSTRKLETTVQLYDGQTLALAGLLQSKFRNNVQKIPGLGDLPILGPLFRSTDFVEEKTELLVAVTPHLVKPVEAGSLRFPGEAMEPPDWYEFYLEGRLEGRRGDGDSSSAQLSAADSIDGGGLEGVFGYQPVKTR